MMDDLTALTDDEFEQLRLRVEDEQRRRWLLATAAQQVERIQRDVLAAEGIADGDEWRQPTGAHDAYPRGAVVTLGVRTFRSRIPANVTRPADPEDPQSSRWWEDITPPDTGDPQTTVGDADAPAWVQPVPGLPDKPAYKKGALVRHDGHLWRSLVDGNVWPPSTVGIWEMVR